MWRMEWEWEQMKWVRAHITLHTMRYIDSYYFILRTIYSYSFPSDSLLWPSHTIHTAQHTHTQTHCSSTAWNRQNGKQRQKHTLNPLYCITRAMHIYFVNISFGRAKCVVKTQIHIQNPVLHVYYEYGVVVFELMRSRSLHIYYGNPESQSK